MMSSVGVGQGLEQLGAALSGLAVPPVMREAITTLAQACAVHADLGKGVDAVDPGSAGPEAVSSGGSASSGSASSGSASSGSASSGSASSTPTSLVRGGQDYSSLAVPEANQWADEAVLDTVVAAERVQGWAEHLSLLAVRALTARTGQELLARAEVVEEQELSSRTRRERFRAETRGAVRLELSALTGWTTAACNERIGLATAPPARAGYALAQLAAGQVGWDRVRMWANRTGSFQAQEAGAVAAVCLDPVAAGGGAAQRLDPETGEVVGQVLSFNQFRKVLEREVVRVEGSDGHSARLRRRTELSERDLFTRLFEHGVGQMSLRGDGPALAAAACRIDDAARRLRAAGDQRSLAAIRADTALALLGYGQLSHLGAETPAPTTGTRSGSGSGGPTEGGCTAKDPVGPVVGDLDQMARVLAGVPTATVELVMPLDVITGTPGAVVEVAGYGYITPEHAREILLAGNQDGTTIHRLVTDPLDGRCVERSRASYKPDKAMIEQLRAADGTCRAPGCTVPAAKCDLDHERAYNHEDPAAGGPTAEVNLNHKHRMHHWGKTQQLWSTVMDALSRKVTWTSLFGRCYRTRPKDYGPVYPAPPDWANPDGCAGHEHPNRAEGHACRKRRATALSRDYWERTTRLRRAGFVLKRYEHHTMATMHDLIEGIYQDHGPAQVLPQALTNLQVVGAGAAPEGDGPTVRDAREGQGQAAGPEREGQGQAAGAAVGGPVPMSALLYSAIAEHESANHGIDDPRIQVDQAMPVELAHLRGSQTRHGARRGTPLLGNLLNPAPSTSAHTCLGGPIKPDPDAPPPF